jgi:hypothetical protein
MPSRSKVAACLGTALVLIGAAITPAAAQADVNQCAPITIGGQFAACITVVSQVVPQSNGDLELDVAATLNVYGQQPTSVTRTATVPLSLVVGTATSSCHANGQILVGSTSGWGGHEYGLGVRRAPGDPTTNECYGLLGLTIANYDPGQTVSFSTPSVSLTSQQPINQPYDVPEICLTTTPGACLGPFDGTISPSLPNPTIDPGGVNPGDPTKLCLGAQPDPTAGSGYAFYIEDHAIGLYSTGEPVYGYFDDSRCIDYVPVGIPHPGIP